MRAPAYSRIGLLALASLAPATGQPVRYQPVDDLQDLVDRGLYGEAERVIRDLRESGTLARDLRTGVLADIVGVAMLDQGRYREADILISESISILNAIGPDDVRVARTWIHLSGVRWAQRRLDEAQVLCERALRVQQRALGNTHPEVVTTLLNLAAIHRERGQFDVAGKYMNEARAADPFRLQKHLKWSIIDLQNKAFLDMANGKPAAARKSLLQALDLSAEAEPGDRLHRVYLLISLAAAETQLKHYGTAESSLQRATALANSELPARRPGARSDSGPPGSGARGPTSP